MSSTLTSNNVPTRMATRSTTGLTARTTIYGDENVAPTGLLGKSVLPSKSSLGVATKVASSTNIAIATKRQTLGDISNMSMNANGQDAKKAALKTDVSLSLKPTVVSTRVPLKTTATLAPAPTITLKPSVSTATATSLLANKPKYPAMISTLEAYLSANQYPVAEDIILSEDEEDEEDEEPEFEEEDLDIQNEQTHTSGVTSIEEDAMDIEHHVKPQMHVRSKPAFDFDQEIDDIDMYDHEDPQFCTEYVQHIFEFLKQKEVRDAVNPRYMEKQVDIVEKHRTILVDWMAEVAVKFRLLTETFFLSINIVDRFLQHKAVARQKLQLVGITSLLIASKFEEIYTPEVRDFIWITAKAYTREEMLKMERLILVTLDFNMATPTPLHFLRRFSKAARSNSEIHTLSKYIIELSLLEYKLLNYLPSVIAAAAVYISRKMRNITPLWNATLEYHTGYTAAEIMPCVRDLNDVVKKQPLSKYKAIYKKYLNPKIMSVASFPVCEDL